MDEKEKEMSEEISLVGTGTYAKKSFETVCKNLGIACNKDTLVAFVDGMDFVRGSFMEKRGKFGIDKIDLIIKAGIVNFLQLIEDKEI